MAQKTGVEILMEIIRNEGVEYVFGLPGGTEVVFLDAMEKQDKIKYILCLHEVIAIGAAEGYARTSGKVGFVNLHTGAGLASAMGLLFNAHRGGVPLVVTSGQVDSRITLEDPHLSGQLVEMVRTITKWGCRITRVEEIPMVMQRAFKMALQPPTGPVFISLPQDVMAQSMDYEYTPSMPLLTNLRPDRDAIKRAMNLLLTARNPMMLVEDGITKNKAFNEVVKLAELLGTPVYQMWMSDVNFPTQHPQYLGEIRPQSPQTKELLSTCDVLIVAGFQLFGRDQYTPGPILSRNTRIIQIDDNPWEIAKNFPVTVGIQGNIKETIAELIDLIEKKLSTQDKQAALKRIAEITRQKGEKTAAFLRQAEAEKDQIPIALSRFLMELKNAIKPGTIIIDDSWSSSPPLRQFLNLDEPGAFQRSRAGGSIGWGMPGTIGAKLAAPDRPVIATCGDGSAIWSIQSLWTAAHYQLPITYIILSNKTYRMVKLGWTALLGDNPGDRHHTLELDNPVMDFCQLAQGMGVHARKVEKPDELSKTLKTAMESGRTELLEISIQAP